MIELLRRRLQQYSITNAVQEEQAIKEILQEVALYALWRAGFFEKAAFQGGTSLRILHGLPRFSEDLDFILLAPDPAFQWSYYFDSLTRTMEEFGVHCELSDRSNMNRVVRQAMIKDDSIGRQLDLSFFDSDKQSKLRVKLEIDTCPPAGTGTSWHYLDFPLDFEICAQDLPSNYALKIHALLCRPYLKGRDWFDFTWYCKQKTAPNLPHLASALQQFGPWAGESLALDASWLANALTEKIKRIDWSQAAQDVAPFLSAVEQASLSLWSERFFADKISKLVQAIEGVNL
ncbi:nucleotidyl transferase AbiEii/AbiGii toxin family protein [Chlorobium sp. BLA1]|uniref:nucleotidyl transferase AbiEii/AbiGii toxin family protein n=1 Tax=Candidatus Chlorobium masyuteum TaxID=2716876 RepID=UPI00142033B7|nr:nucleotidyl transferase AbiEii/AbiGii toxin family protein [Candidatus Chlorobium masyuteum]NHQ60111.1 nucleotidyl transferase AbiEii/AbiGii toxin family protein [Candidatus Chlorobium masyuteum]